MDKDKADAAQAAVETPEAESTEEFTEADAEAAFAEGLGESASEASDGTTDKKTAPEDSEITDDTDQPGAAESATQPADKTGTSGTDTEDGDGPSKKPTYEDLEKQLNDTKQWAHGLSETVAELKKKIDSTEPPRTPSGKTDQDDDIPEDIESYFEDYPEAKKAFEFLAKKHLGGMNADEIKTTVATMQGQINQANFEKAVVTGFMAEDGQWIDGHPDAYKVMATPAYQEWFSAELKRDPTLGSISDPSSAIGVLTRFKTQSARSAAAAHDADAGGGMAQDVKDIAAGAVQTGTSTGTDGETKPDEDKSPEEIFEEYAK